MIDKGAVIPDQWKDITTQDISDLTNTFAYNYAEGGEVGNPDDDFTKAINTKLGRTPDGRPKEQGLKPVFDLENAADEKDFIINYLIDCLVENQPFDCSSLGPNKYLNE